MSPKAVTASNPSSQSKAIKNQKHMKDLSRDDLLNAYRMMVLSRRLDEKEIQLKNQSATFFQISAAGHEAVQVAAGMLLRPGYDWIFPYYRDRALCLTLGVSPTTMLLGGVGSAEDPSSGGRQMPSHWSSRESHIVSPSSALGTQCHHAVGCAEAGVLAATQRTADKALISAHDDEVVLVSLGEGATSEGEFWEALSATCLRKLPVVYLIQDNGYAISVPVDAQTPGGSISTLVERFPTLRTINIDGTDFFESYSGMHEAITYAQSRKGPALVHASVVRLHSHSLSDDQKAYRSEEECKADLEQDPLKLFKHRCIEESIASEADLKKIESAVDNDIAEAASQALKASQPNPATVLDYLYSPKIDPASTAFTSEPTPSGDPETMVTAINHTLRDEMTCNPHMVMFGEDIADCSRTESLPSVSGKGGVFKVTHGLQRAFGEDRVFNTQVAEAGIVGRALGMAIRGIKPVVEIQFFDYIWPAMMQLRNEISMLRYRSNNTYACPMVIRVPIGGYLRGGSLYHSQSGESIFAHCPGLRIAYPSNAEDASGLLRTAIRCDDPVLFLEHKHLYRQTYNKRPYPGADYTIPFGQAAVRREGHDIVVVTWGALVQRSLLAAQQASKANISVMVLDLRTIAPYDWESIASAIQQTNRVVIAHEDQLTCGFGAELGSRIAEELFDCLDAPIKRVAALDCPVAYHPILEEQILPQTNDILKAIQEVASY